ncbi:hypothetical protein, partial [Fervidobacterium sp.]
YVRESPKEFILFLNNYDDFTKSACVRLDDKHLGEIQVPARKGIILLVSKTDQTFINITTTVTVKGEENLS